MLKYHNMKDPITLFYFSGTGNSLHCARMLAEKTNAELLSILTAQKSPTIKPKGMIGFVFPVYFMNLPVLLERFIQNTDLSTTEYIFAVAVSGGDGGDVFYWMNRLLEKKGKRLDYSQEIKLGDNSIVIQPKADDLEKKFDALEPIIDRIVDEVKKRTVNNQNFHKTFHSEFYSFITRFGLEKLYRMNDKKTDSEKCNQCGQCVRLCPADNIRLESSKISFGDDCAECFACINWCPQRAIRFGIIDPGKKGRQYRSKNITAGDIANAKAIPAGG